jgi:STE24 endopeptidase
LARERRRLYFVGIVLSILAPIIPYLTGTWESFWYALAATDWPIAGRTLIFLTGFQLALAIVYLPLGYYRGYELAHRFGLSRQSLRGWLRDWLVGTALTAAFGSAMGGAFLWLVSNTGDQWWLATGLLTSVVVPAVGFLVPYVVVPLFFRMRPLEDAATVGRIRQLLKRAGAEVRDVCSLDFSRRTAEANAAVIGLGRSRRVVIADTMLAEFTPSEVDAVVAHELGHHVHRDVPRLLGAYLLLVWVGLGVAAWVVPYALPVLSIPSLAYVPAYPMLLGIVELFSVLTAPLSNWWSRRVEAAADRFALQLTRDPAAFAGAMRRLAAQNLVEIQQPRWVEILLASHPSIHRRIALAEGSPV